MSDVENMLLLIHREDIAKMVRYPEDNLCYDVDTMEKGFLEY